MSFLGRQMFSRSTAALRLSPRYHVSRTILVATLPRIGNLSQLRWYQSRIKSMPFYGTRVDRSSLKDKRANRLRHQQEAYGGLSVEALKLATDVLDGKVNPTDYMQPEIEAKRATSEKVRACLRAGFERIRNFPRRERMKILQEEKQHLARVALDMLWQDQDLWAPLLVYDYQARDALCYFAVAENLQQLITRWLNLDLPEENLDEGLRGWRGRLFNAMVKALLIHDTNRSATKALEYFFTVHRMKYDARDAHRKAIAAGISSPPLLATLALAPASLTIAGKLTQGQCPETDTKVYDKFQRFFETFRGPNDILFEYNIGAIAAYHPTRPDPRRSLLFLQTHLTPMASPADVVAFEVESLIPGYISGMVSRTERLLRDQGHTSDARWVEQQAVRLRIALHVNPWDPSHVPRIHDNFTATGARRGVALRTSKEASEQRRPR